MFGKDEFALFDFSEIEKAKGYTFLELYDDLFHQHSGIDRKTIIIKDLEGLLVGRGTILSEKEVLDYERFILKKSPRSEIEIVFSRKKKLEKNNLDKFIKT